MPLLLRIRLKALLSHQNSSDQAYIFTTQVKKTWKPFQRSQCLFLEFFTIFHGHKILRFNTQRTLGLWASPKLSNNYANNLTINISKFVSCEKLCYVITFVNQTANYMWYFTRNCLGLVARIVMTYFSIFLSRKLCSRQELK